MNTKGKFQAVKKHPNTTKQPIRRQTSNTFIGGGRNNNSKRDQLLSSKQAVMSFADQDKHLVIPASTMDDKDGMDGFDILNLGAAVD